MSTVQTNITLGTAGHIDHGKTALIKCLTGCDTDRLKAEKQRGMSIELGFAPCLISDTEIGIVDVPGHENFIKTMVAGASGIDGVIFVIAADDGVMPQTREHLDILTLLGVKSGITALTKVDCIAKDRLQTVTKEVRDFLTGTFLENAPILPVSSITAEGFDAFVEGLKELVGKIQPKASDGVFRMPIERTFSLKGYGTVVTGIPVSGSIKTGGEAVLLPQALKGRIKAIQAYKKDSDTAIAGQCSALNVPSLDYKIINRGDVITVGEYFTPQKWYLCKLHVLDSNKLVLKNGTKVKFHTGTSEVVSTIYLTEAASPAAGQKCFIQVKLNAPVVAGPGDRFIVRSLSPSHTIGGGMIIEAISKKLKRSQPGVLEDIRQRANAILVNKDFVEYCIKKADSNAVTKKELLFRTKLLPEKLEQILADLTNQGKVFNLTSKKYIHLENAPQMQQQLLEIISHFHSKNPESPGISNSRLCEASGLEKDVFDGLVKLLISDGKLIERKHRLALPQHRETFNETEQKLLDSVESLFKGAMFTPPKPEEVVQATKAAAKMIEKILQILIEQESLVRVDNNLFFHREAVKKARQKLTEFIEKEGMLESVKFKYLLDTSRKFAIPLLDYFDRIGVTNRVGNTRYLKKQN